MQSSFDESIRMIEGLSADVENCYKMIKEEDNQFWRRTFIRTVFAFVECFIFRMKQSALDIHNLNGNIFNEAGKLSYFQAQLCHTPLGRWL